MQKETHPVAEFYGDLRTLMIYMDFLSRGMDEYVKRRIDLVLKGMKKNVQQTAEKALKLQMYDEAHMLSRYTHFIKSLTVNDILNKLEDTDFHETLQRIHHAAYNVVSSPQLREELEKVAVKPVVAFTRTEEIASFVALIVSILTLGYSGYISQSKTAYAIKGESTGLVPIIFGVLVVLGAAIFVFLRKKD